MQEALSMQNTSLKALLDISRQQLLDLSARNRLIHMPLGSKTARLVQVFDEKSTEVYRTLVQDHKQMTFLPGTKGPVTEQLFILQQDRIPDPDEEELADLPIPQDNELDFKGRARRHVDTKLQTRLTQEKLQRRVFDYYNEAREIIEEQGVNILYITLGALKWIDTDYGKTERFAPLVLVPVELVRGNARERFALRWREEDVAANLCLAEKLRIEHGIMLPAFEADDTDVPAIEGYLEKVSQAVSGQAGWEVQADTISLGFFSFAKYLMYKDLDAANWPEGNSILSKPLIKSLLAAQEDDQPLQQTTWQEWSDTERLDERIPVERLDHVVDADASQTVAIEMVREGRSLVIQGPPGTGKSQTITNIIATAVLDGKKVLFLAEKLAALEVVHRRLEAEHLGALCLELHSSKARKALVMGELKKTWELGKLSMPYSNDAMVKLDTLRKELAAHPRRLHTTPQGMHHSPYLHLGKLANLGKGGQEEQTLSISGLETWEPTRVEKAIKQLQVLAKTMADVGRPSENPWRGIELAIYVGTEELRITAALEHWENTLRRLGDITVQYGTQLTNVLDSPADLASARRLSALAKVALAKPDVACNTLSDPVWDERLAEIEALTSKKASLDALMAGQGKDFIAQAWQQDSSPLRVALTSDGKKWYKFLLSGYKQMTGQLQGLFKTTLPKTYEEKLALIDVLLEGQEYTRTLQKQDELGRQAFGNLWSQERNGAALKQVVSWVSQAKAAFHGKTARIAAWQSDVTNLEQLESQLPETIREEANHRQEVEKLLALRWENYGLSGNFENTVYASHLNLSGQWRNRLAELPAWVTYFHNRQETRLAGLSVLVDFAEKHLLSDKEISDSFNRLLSRQALEHAFNAEPELSRFDGKAHTDRVATFREMDHIRKDLARLSILDQHANGIPPKMQSGATGIVLGEVNKQRNHKAIRQLLRLAGPAVQALKPVFMMSPLSVAQFLEPGAVKFDLLVIDEASQVQPVDALGAIARCKQIVVVGDDKQLPPTSFFSKVASNTEGSEDDLMEDSGVVKANELESVLSLCKARGLKDTMLRWHYRSRHHSLIAVSNKEYYENKLFIVPSPYHAGVALGLRFRPVPGIYDRGNTRTNPIEARAVAEAVIEHAIHETNYSLLVAAFSGAQQRAIQDQIECLRIERPEAEKFFTMHPHEPFTVKNLENVQGDERDIVFLSVGYGRDKDGYIAMQFGPLSSEGGQRRLNVLISRAKRRCEVFASISDHDIDLSKTKSLGVRGLKEYLQFARTGQLSVAEQSGRPMDSPLEEAVKSAIERELGYEVHSQVGASGFFIDLALVDPEHKGRYVLGIECDGVAYHSSPSARERDRLRQSVLEGQGWTMHRLWGIDFFRRPADEIAKIKVAYEKALKDLEEADTIKVVAPEDERNVFSVSRMDANGEAFAFVKPYTLVSLSPLAGQDPYKVPVSTITRLVSQVIASEAPIHLDEIVTRIRMAFNFGRAGDRFRTLVVQAAEVLVAKNEAKILGAFLYDPSKPIQVRSRTDAPDASRKAAFIPPDEIDLALYEIIKLSHGLLKAEAAKEVNRAFGFTALRDEMKSRVEERISSLLSTNQIKEEAGLLTVISK